MKKLVLSAFLIFCSRMLVLASGETLEWLYTDATGNQTWETGADGSVLAPCSGINLEVTYTPPAGYSVSQYKWYINNVLYTTYPSSHGPGATLPALHGGANNIQCIITYASGSTTTTGTSNVLTFSSQQLGVQVNQSNNAVAGCTSPVSFTTSTFSSMFVYTPSASEYEVTWQPPTGWAQSSISSNGQSVTFTPNTTGAGAIYANIQLINYTCPFTQQLSNTVTRTTPATSFPNTNPVVVCQSGNPATFTITDACGASSYTYTLSGGAVFSNNTTSLTTTADNASVDFTTIGSTRLSAVVNYPTGVSSPAVSLGIQYGTPATPTGFENGSATCPEYSFQVNPGPSGTTYTWSYYNEATRIVTTAEVNNSSIGKMDFSGLSGNFVAQVQESNTCGISAIAALPLTINCGSEGGHSIAAPLLTGVAGFDSTSTPIVPPAGFSVFPNPAKDHLYISLGTATNKKDALNGIREVSLYNALGIRVAYFSYQDMPRLVNINLPSLASGAYALRIADAKAIKTQVILISK